MRKTLIAGAAFLAAVPIGLAASAAAVQAPPPMIFPPLPPPAVDPITGDSEPVAIPAAQAALVFQTGSDTIYFRADQYALDEPSRATLAAHALWLIANPAVRASVEGHSEEHGTREHLLGLSERRANAARDFLIQQGVPAMRLLTVGWGKERPAAPGSNEQSWAQNRRVVVLVVR